MAAQSKGNQMDRAEFYAHLRKRGVTTFGTSLSVQQVKGIEAILDAGAGSPMSHVAYALATARGEVGSAMQPTEENLRYSASRIPQVFSSSRRNGHSASSLAYNPQKLANVIYGGTWGKNNLGNTQSGDGWRFRGRGFPMATGRRNYEKLSDLTGFDLVNNPDLMMRLDISARASLFTAMRIGLYTGKAFDDYLPNATATYQQFKNARRIINGTFHADKIAKFAVDFQDALKAAGYKPEKPLVVPKPTPIPQVAQEAAAPKVAAPKDETRTSIGAVIANIWAAFFGGKS